MRQRENPPRPPYPPHHPPTVLVVSEKHTKKIERDKRESTIRPLCGRPLLRPPTSCEKGGGGKRVLTWPGSNLGNGRGRVLTWPGSNLGNEPWENSLLPQHRPPLPPSSTGSAAGIACHELPRVGALQCRATTASGPRERPPACIDSARCRPKPRRRRSLHNKWECRHRSRASGASICSTTKQDYDGHE